MQAVESRPSLMGEAGRLGLVAGPILAIAVLLTVVAPDAVSFLGPFWGAGIAAGIVLGGLGMVFWGFAAVGLLRAWRADRLATAGAFGLVRHPIFAWWIWFVLPAAALIVDSWALLLCAAAILVAAIPAARREEAAMEARYGEVYASYRSRVRMLVPLPRLRPVTLRRIAGFVGIAAAAAVVAALSFYAIVRPVMLGLGVSGEERAARMAGDDMISDVRSGYTQAYEIGAPPEDVWPWLVQVGQGRGGWYNVDAINRLASPDYFYEGNASARRIIPELQNLREGDTIDLAPGVGLTVVELVENERLLLVGDPSDPRATSNAVWLYELRQTSDGSTRLFVRFASTFPGGILARLLNGFVNELGGAIIQQPAMLRGIDRRATGRLRTAPR